MKKIKIFALLIVVCFLMLIVSACSSKTNSDSSLPEIFAPSTPQSTPEQDDDSSDDLSDATDSDDSSDLDDDSDLDTNMDEETPESSSEPEIVIQPPPVFADGSPSIVSSEGKKITVNFKTDVSSTINAILTTNSEKISTTAFYDYFNRGKDLAGAISKHKEYGAGADGLSITFEIEDANQNYYLHVNAVENETGTWQKSVTTILIYEPSMLSPTISAEDAKTADEGALIIFDVTSDIEANVYAIVTPAGQAAPQPKDIKANSYGSATKLFISGKSQKDADKQKLALTLTTASLESGNYTIWITAQNSNNDSGTFSKVVQKDFSIK